MPSTHTVLRQLARFIDLHGLHRGEQMATRQPWRLDICAAAYIIANDFVTPDVFYTDEAASLTLIETSEPAMAAIRAISQALDSDVCETGGLPDYIEHVSTWAMTPPLGSTTSPSISEVIGRILRAADTAAQTPA